MTSRRKSTGAAAAHKRARSNSSINSNPTNNQSPRVPEKTASARSSYPPNDQTLQSGDATHLRAQVLNAHVNHQGHGKGAQKWERPIASYHRASSSSSSASSSVDSESDVLQRFSNTSAHPRRSRKSNHSPPQLSATPPPSPPRAQRAEDEEEENTQRAHAAPPPTRQALPPSLLSELLQAEAERADAAAAVAAVFEVSALASSNHLQTTTQPHPSQHAMGPLAAHNLNLPSTSGPREETAGAVAIHIGVVPLPGSTQTSKTSSSDGGVLPWVRALHAAAAASAPSAATTPTTASVSSRLNSPNPPPRTEAEIESANVRQLRPFCVPLRSQHPSTASTPSRSVIGVGEHAYISKTASSLSSAVASEAVVVGGWSGLFWGVPLLLRGAQPPSSSVTLSEAEGRPRHDQVNKACDIPLDAQVCLGAATVMLMLA